MSSADETIPFGKARIAREGTSVTVVTWGRPVGVVLDVAKKLAGEGIECEVIDPRTLRPLDHATIVESVKKTNRCVVVHEHWEYGGPGAEVVASTFDEPSGEHVHVSDIALEKAKRMVEDGKDVVILLDSITRLARAHNTEAPAGGKLLSGGLDSNA